MWVWLDGAERAELGGEGGIFGVEVYGSVPRFARLGFGMDGWAGSDSLTWWRGKRWCVSGPGDVGWIFARGIASCSSTFGSRRAHYRTNWDIEVQYVEVQYVDVISYLVHRPSSEV